MSNIRRLLLQQKGAPGYRSAFDQGSGSIDAEAGRITPVSHWDSKWAWWCLRHAALGGLQPTYLIAKAAHYNLAAGERLACWALAADTDTWTDFATVTIGDSDISIQDDAAFPAGRIYIAALPMYPYSRVARLVREWLASPLASDTESGTDGVIGTMTARDAGDGSGRTVPALPIYGFKISSGAGTKNIAVLTAYNHPSETPGSYQLEGALAWLLGGSDLASFLLDYFDFYVYPCLNPQGVWAGYFRSCPEDPTLDHNRQWAAGGLECVDAIKTAMLADTGGTVEVGLDYHSWMDNTDIFADVQTGDAAGAIYAAFLAKMQALDADFNLQEQDLQTTLRYLWKDTYSAKLAAILEQGGEIARGVAEWKTYGAQSLQAIARMLADGRWTNGPAVGSRDFNGSTDRLDWANIANLSGAALTISAWVWPSSTPAQTNEYVVCMHDAGDASYGIVFNLLASGQQVDFLRHGATDYLWFSSGNVLTRDAWHHIIITSNGGLLEGSVVFYIDGATIAQSFTNGSGAETAHTGKWSLGGRIYSDNRNLEGRIAQVGIWNRVLTAGEIALLAAGYAPALAAPSGMLFGPPLNTESLVDPISELTATADGTSQLTGVGNGPGIIY